MKVTIFILSHHQKVTISVAMIFKFVVCHIYKLCLLSFQIVELAHLDSLKTPVEKLYCLKTTFVSLYFITIIKNMNLCNFRSDHRNCLRMKTWLTTNTDEHIKLHVLDIREVQGIFFSSLCMCNFCHYRFQWYNILLIKSILSNFESLPISKFCL